MGVFSYLFGAATGGMFLFDVIRCLYYVVIAMLCMRLLKKNYANILIFVPIIVLLLCVSSLRQYIVIFLNHLVEAINQFEKVSGFSPAYADYMKYLYLEPLGNALFILVHFIPYVAASLITYLDYKKLISVTHQEQEMRKMTIKDL